MTVPFCFVATTLVVSSKSGQTTTKLVQKKYPPPSPAPPPDKEEEEKDRKEDEAEALRKAGQEPQITPVILAHEPAASVLQVPTYEQLFETRVRIREAYRAAKSNFV